MTSGSRKTRFRLGPVPNNDPTPPLKKRPRERNFAVFEKQVFPTISRILERLDIDCVSESMSHPYNTPTSVRGDCRRHAYVYSRLKMHQTKNSHISVILVYFRKIPHFGNVWPLGIRLEVVWNDLGTFKRPVQYASDYLWKLQNFSHDVAFFRAMGSLFGTGPIRYARAVFSSSGTGLSIFSDSESSVWTCLENRS